MAVGGGREAERGSDHGPQAGADKGDYYLCVEGVIEKSYGFVCEESGEVLSENIIYDEGAPRVRDERPVEAATLTFTQHDLGVGADIVSAPRRNPLKRKGRSPRSSRVVRSDVPLVTALRMLNEASETLGLSKSAQETAALLVRAYYRSVKRAPGRHEPIVAAAILKASELHNLALSQGEVVDYFGVTAEELWRARAKLALLPVARSMYLKALKASRERGRDRFLERTSSFIKRISASLNLPPEVAKLAMSFIETSLKSERGEGLRKDLNGKRPEAVAAAAVYLAANILGYDEVSQKSVARVVKLKESNVRKHYRFLIDNVTILVYV